MRRPFQFKQFTVTDSRSAMKLSTDAVILGSFACLDGAGHILDVGTGSGIVALMLAQRCDADITAIDIDAGSVEDARQNFSDSPWRNRLHALHQSLQEFAGMSSQKFDVIVSNPPYFANSHRSPYPGRNLSKHDAGLTIAELIPLARSLLQESGSCSFIIPAAEHENFQRSAAENELILKRNLWIVPKPSREPNRVLLTYSPVHHRTPEESFLTIRHEDNSFTHEYRAFTKDFYLDF